MNILQNQYALILAAIVIMFLIYMYFQPSENMIPDLNPSTFYYLDQPNTNEKVSKSPPKNENDNTNSKCDPGNFVSSNLLPKTNDVVRDDAFKFAPGDLTKINFLSADQKIGENTIGNSLRNANRQLRSEPANPQKPVSPWLNSTIEPDLHRRPLE